MSDLTPEESDAPDVTAPPSEGHFAALSKAWMAQAFVLVSGFFMASFAIRLTIEVWWELPSSSWIMDVHRAHYAATVAVPVAMVEAFFLVLILKQFAGDMEFEVLGFKFRGASGPLVLWVLCFLTIIFAVWLLWNVEAPGGGISLPDLKFPGNSGE